MPLEDRELYFENLHTVNKNSFLVLKWMMLLAPVFALFTYLQLFRMDYKFLAILEIIVVCSNVVYYIFMKKRMEMCAMCFGLSLFSIMVSVMATQGTIGIYISYAMPVFIACLYYNSKVLAYVTVLNYVGMIVSLYFRGKALWLIGDEEIIQSPMFYFVSKSLGYTIEYFFVFIVSRKLSKSYMVHYNIAYTKSKALFETQLDVMNFVPNVLESHEIFTGHHVRHTVKYVEMIAKQLVKTGHYTKELTDENIKVYAAAANLHDIGKVHIPDNILNKPGRYTPEEYSMMKMHPGEGKRLIETMPVIDMGDFNNIASDMAFYHHEKYDGTGYPNGLKGQDIPLCARIMAAADVLDALLSWRPYKQPFDIEKTMEIFEDSRGTHFESCIVDAVFALKDEIQKVSEDFKLKESEDELKEFEWRTQLEKSKDSK